MKITAIKVQVRPGARYSIFIDGKYPFSFSEAGLLEYKLHSGQQLDDTTLRQLQQASNEDKLYGDVLRYIALRPRSEWEIRFYMQRKQASPALTEKMLNKLSESKLIDDERFTAAWVENRQLLRPVSKRKLQQELRAKRISDEIIGNVLTSEDVDEHKSLRDIVAKKRARYPDKLKLMQYLSRQGFRYEDIKSVLNEFDEAD
jgi:regulatory protein